jgi:AraC-like DNA-binding protein
MDRKSNQQAMLELATKLGIPMTNHLEELSLLDLYELRIIDLLPSMMVMIRSLVSKEAFSFRREPITLMEKGLLITFQNVFYDRKKEVDVVNSEQPHVRVMPLHLASEIRFPERSHIKQITILIELTYLQQFLGNDQHRFDYLFEQESTFWIEDFMSPQMALLVDQVVSAPSDVTLSGFYYRTKSLDLLYLLFNSLSSRQSPSYYQMRSEEIDAIYKVRNELASSLDRPIPIEELVKVSGMNEQKLRQFFIQVFGKGLYGYYQHLRMQEAARLLKDQRLTVSETGYRLGFSNLSHFGRLFEAHFGLKPKKWSSR